MQGFQAPLILKCLPKERSKFRFEVYEKPLEYITCDDEWISVPVGFKTDFASVPWIFRRLIPATGRYNEATVLHDYLCYLSKKGLYDRRRADALFMEAMESLDVKKITRGAMFAGVRSYTELVSVKNKILRK